MATIALRSGLGGASTRQRRRERKGAHEQKRRSQGGTPARAEDSEGQSGNASGEWGAPPREHVMGLVVYGYGMGMRGALVDTTEGSFLKPGAQTELKQKNMDGVAEAARKVVDKIGWEGRIGCGLPGLINEKGAVQWLGVGSPTKLELEQKIEQATGCRVMVKSVSEMNAQGELSYGVGLRLSPTGLTLVCTIGRTFGAALFEDGELVPNLDVTSITEAYRPDGGGPPEPDEEDFSLWRRYAEQVDRVLLQLESILQPDRVVIAGPAADGFERLYPLLTLPGRLKDDVYKAELGPAGAVKGAAKLAQEEFKARDSLTQLRLAIGQENQISPQSMSESQLWEVFNRFETSGDGYLDENELEVMLSVLGVANVGRDTVHGVLTRLDTHDEGKVSWQEFLDWWYADVVNEPIRLVVSGEEFEDIVQETPSSQLICLEVGMTFCRPCKAFEKKYRGVAEEYQGVRFLRLNANENPSCTTLARDRLGVRSTPSFYFFRGRSNKPVHFHSGANENRLRSALDEFLADPTKEESIDAPAKAPGLSTSSQQQQQENKAAEPASSRPAGGWGSAFLGTHRSPSPAASTSAPSSSQEDSALDDGDGGDVKAILKEIEQERERATRLRKRAEQSDNRVRELEERLRSLGQNAFS